MGLSDNSKGLILAVASSAFIGSSFILKKKGLKRAGASATRAGLPFFFLLIFNPLIFMSDRSLPILYSLNLECA